MHEFTLAKNIGSIIIAQFDTKQYQQVTRIILSVGELLAVDNAALTFALMVVGKGTVFEKATLVVETLPGEALCDSCQKTVKIKKYAEPCCYCGQYQLTITQGEELRVKSMEVV